MILMAGKHLLIGLIVSQDCERTVAEQRGEELKRNSTVLIKTKENNICAEWSFLRTNSNAIAFSIFTISCCYISTLHTLRQHCLLSCQALMMRRHLP